MDDGGDALLAAEYVLGVLPPDERRAFAARLEADGGLRMLVWEWERRLSPLDAAYRDVPAPASAKAAIDRRLFAGPDPAPQGRSLWNSLAFWRGLSVAALASLAVIFILPFFVEPEPGPARYVAAMQADASPVRYVALYQAGSGSIDLTRLAGEPAAGRDFELWLIEGGNPPRSLGLLPDGGTARMPLAPALASRLAGGATLAISDEPVGGSPTGAPTGAVLALGELRGI
ncbi:anti-sigma factor domain-containing protein [Zhengella sp. ZM62]